MVVQLIVIFIIKFKVNNKMNWNLVYFNLICIINYLYYYINIDQLF